MATYRTIYLSFWTDTKVDDEMTPEEKYFYLYLLTNPHTNLCGCYEISMKSMIRETGYNEDTVKRLIARMETAHDVIRYDSQTKEVLILNWHKYNWAKSEKTLAGVEASASKIKSEAFFTFIADTLEATYGYPMHTPYKGYGYPLYTSVTDTVTDTDTDSVTDAVTDHVGIPSNGVPIRYHRFVPPTKEEVEAYCAESGHHIDADTFVDFYQAKGWKVGKDSMKDWKAAVRNWARRDKERNTAKGADKYGGQKFDQKTVRFDELDNMIGVIGEDEQC